MQPGPGEDEVDLGSSLDGDTNVALMFEKTVSQ
jgi:hypothetical protein